MAVSLPGDVPHAGPDDTFWVPPLGGALAIAFTVYACIRVGTPALLTVLFALWVGWPFAALAVAASWSARWPPPARRMLNAMTMLTAVGCCLLYGVVAIAAARPSAPPFVIVPPASALVVMLVVGGVAFRSRRR